MPMGAGVPAGYIGDVVHDEIAIGLHRGAIRGRPSATGRPLRAGLLVGHQVAIALIAQCAVATRRPDGLAGTKRLARTQPVTAPILGDYRKRLGEGADTVGITRGIIDVPGRAGEIRPNRDPGRVVPVTVTGIGERGKTATGHTGIAAVIVVRNRPSRLTWPLDHLR